MLYGITGSVQPGELLALMGPSGGGKTTLLSMLGGRTPKAARTDGHVTFNGEALSKRVKRMIGFVMQDDLLYEALTVQVRGGCFGGRGRGRAVGTCGSAVCWQVCRAAGAGLRLDRPGLLPTCPSLSSTPPSPQETLYYAAMLRLPSTMTRAQKRARVETVIAALGLGQCRDTIIGECCAGAIVWQWLAGARARSQGELCSHGKCGGPLRAGGFFRRGVSGGERKRVSVGHELLINPSVLLLDEPTRCGRACVGVWRWRGGQGSVSSPGSPRAEGAYSGPACSAPGACYALLEKKGALPCWRLIRPALSHACLPRPFLTPRAAASTPPPPVTCCPCCET